MKTKLLVLFLVLFISVSHSQVGIGTTDPVSTLDVTGNPSDASSLCGITPPRVSGDELAAKTYTSNQNGTLVYATSAASTPSGQTSNVTAEGIYVFSGSQNKWMGLNVSTYSGNSQMMMRKLNFSGSSTPYGTTTLTITFNFEHEVFNTILGSSYDTTNDRIHLPVGIYKIESHLTPSAKLYVDWILRLNGAADYANSTIGTAIAATSNDNFGTAGQMAIIEITSTSDYIDFQLISGRSNGKTTFDAYNNQSYLTITRIQ